MTPVSFLLAALVTTADAKTPGPACLSDAQMRAAVAEKRVVPPATALRAARASIGGETIRARLCRRDGDLVYVITALRRDGRVRSVVIDGATGKVAPSR